MWCVPGGVAVLIRFLTSSFCIVLLNPTNFFSKEYCVLKILSSASVENINFPEIVFIIRLKQLGWFFYCAYTSFMEWSKYCITCTMELLKTHLTNWENLEDLTGNPLNTEVIHKRFNEECAGEHRGRKRVLCPVDSPGNLASETMHCRQLQSLNRIFLQQYIFTSCRVHLFLCTSHCWNIQTTQSVFLAVAARMHPFEDFSMTSLLTVVLNKQMAIIDLTSQVSSLSFLCFSCGMFQQL